MSEFEGKTEQMVGASVTLAGCWPMIAPPFKSKVIHCRE
jgi:hypothetical protein